MSTYTLSLNDFTIPSWWLAFLKENRVSPDEDITNVVEFQVATGDSRENRVETIRIKQISLEGKWINADQLHITLILIWLSVASLHALFKLKNLHLSLLRERAAVKSLTELNELLNVEKEQYAKMAKKDELTNLSNRAGVRDILFRLQQEFKRKRSPALH
jgi:hypothetical protein